MLLIFLRKIRGNTTIITTTTTTTNTNATTTTSVCKLCDIAFWYYKKYDVVIKYCKGNDITIITTSIIISTPTTTATTTTTPTTSITITITTIMIITIIITIIITGCKVFLTLAEFEEKIDASKCGKCRRRGRTGYLIKKRVILIFNTNTDAQY